MAFETWWKIEFSSADRESVAQAASQLGCSGAEFLENSFTAAYYCGPRSDAEEIARSLESIGASVSSISNFENENWVQKCVDLWEPIEVGTLTIVPVLESSQLSQDNTQQSIYIIPSSGFGTGHHETTRLCLEFIQSKTIGDLNPKSVLDLGTGSGILSIACAKLFGSHAAGYDISENALNNAAENIALNKVEHLVDLHHSKLDTERSFPLIVANIYAEVLVSHEKALSSHLEDGGVLIVSGISDDKEALFTMNFENSNWEILRRAQLGQWLAFMLKK